MSLPGAAMTTQERCGGKPGEPNWRDNRLSFGWAYGHRKWHAEIPFQYDRTRFPIVLDCVGTKGCCSPCPGCLDCAPDRFCKEHGKAMCDPHCKVPRHIPLRAHHTDGSPCSTPQPQEPVLTREWAERRLAEPGTKEETRALHAFLDVLDKVEKLDAALDRIADFNAQMERPQVFVGGQPLCPVCGKTRCQPGCNLNALRSIIVESRP